MDPNPAVRRQQALGKPVDCTGVSIGTRTTLRPIRRSGTISGPTARSNCRSVPENCSFPTAPAGSRASSSTGRPASPSIPRGFFSGRFRQREVPERGVCLEAFRYSCDSISDFVKARLRTSPDRTRRHKVHEGLWRRDQCLRVFVLLILLRPRIIRATEPRSIEPSSTEE
jgi:hypothetical protein